MCTPKILLTISPERVEQLFTEKSYKRLQNLGQIVRNLDKEMPEEEIIDNMEDTDIVIAGHKTIFPKEALRKATNLKVFAETSGSPPRLGKDFYKSALERGVYILSCSPALAIPVAEFALGLIINLLRNLTGYHMQMRERTEQFGYCAKNSGDLQLTDKQIGIVGLGRVARTFVRFINPFNLKIRVFDPFVPKELAKEFGVELTELDNLLSKSDIVVLMANPNPTSEHLLDERAFRLLKEGAFLVNVARAILIDKEALLEWLQEGKGKAALDVFDQEPLPADSPLRELPNVILTPHRAGGLTETYHRIGSFLVGDLEDILNGREPRKMLRITPEVLRRI